jgi:biotin synthase
MMGNFLTTLGSTPDDDRAMFEQFGLNVARQPDNGANPRPDNRSGWMQGQTPERDGVEPAAGLEVRLWDPSTQLRFTPKRSVPPRPDGAPNAGQGRPTREAATAAAVAAVAAVATAARDAC